ncbi:MAG: hypothetical protein JNM39_10300 [Bdellovibrionaceae bacterium]|nr:hypothetical protein [Pseudobdellovibrionaceae bacterium]
MFQLLSRTLLVWMMISAFTEIALGAACCGGGGGSASGPSLIADDNMALFASSYSMTEVVVDNVDSKGIWRVSSEHQQIKSLKLELSHVFWDRWQAGLALPFFSRSQYGQSYSGLGDIAGMVGYEILPDWNYNFYRPKILGYLQLTLPTGKSKMESEIGGLDSRGNGLWALGAGTLITKTWSRWDVFSSLELHRAFEKQVNNSQISGTLKPGFGGNFGVGVGYNLQSFRLGSSLTWTHEDPAVFENSFGVSPGTQERYATGALSASYIPNDDWTGTLSYSDQTLFGDPLNTSLGRALAIQLQHHWQR